MPFSKTKELAKKLGVIGQKRKQKTNDGVTKKKKRGQLLSYLMVIDFESTCWENKRDQQEIIEFPAVLLDLSSGEVMGEFQQYVLPTEHPILSDFCKQLTGITQEQVDRGVPIQTCLYLFKQWLCEQQHKTGLVMMEPGKEYSHDQQLCSVATWSDWDLGVCLYYECRRKQVRVPVYFNQWVNIRALYKIFYERRPSGVRGSLEDLGLAFVGQEHSGIDDARNTAKLCYRMVKDGCKLNITKSTSLKAISIIKPPGGSNVQEQSEQATTASTNIVSTACTSTTQVQSNVLATCTCTGMSTHSDSSVSKGILCPKEQSTKELSTALKSQVSETFTSTALRSEERCGTAPNNQQEKMESPWDNFEDDFTEEAFVGDIGLAEKDQTVKCDMLQTKGVHQQDIVIKHTSSKQLQTSNRVVSHTVAPLNLLSSITSTIHILGPLPSSTTHCASTKTIPLNQRTDIDTHNIIRIPSVSRLDNIRNPSTSYTPQCSTSHTPHSSISYTPHRSTSHTPHSSISYTPHNSTTFHTPRNSTSHTPHSSILSSYHKVTPPMCDCGRRTKRKLVSKSGPNEGKPFYVCPISSGSSKGKGCGFFRWEGAQKENVFSSTCTSSLSSAYSDL